MKMWNMCGVLECVCVCVWNRERESVCEAVNTSFFLSHTHAFSHMCVHTHTQTYTQPLSSPLPPSLSLSLSQKPFPCTVIGMRCVRVCVCARVCVCDYTTHISTIKTSHGSAPLKESWNLSLSSPNGLPNLPFSVGAGLLFPLLLPWGGERPWERESC